MKRNLLILLMTTLLCSFIGCSSVNVNMQNTTDIHGTKLGDDALINIGGRLCYDETTRIVYIGDVYRLSAYYAPNGLPYKYNPETNMFEEINNE